MSAMVVWQENMEMGEDFDLGKDLNLSRRLLQQIQLLNAERHFKCKTLHHTFDWIDSSRRATRKYSLKFPRDSLMWFHSKSTLKVVFY